jgi:excisionase family DNA binding protein
LLNVSEKTIRRWVTDGKVPYVKLPSGGVRVPQGALLASLEGTHDLAAESSRSMHGLRMSPRTTCAPAPSSDRFRAG